KACILSRDPDVTAAGAKILQIPHALRGAEDLRRMKDELQLQLAMVVVPNRAHAEWASVIHELGMGLWLEKPAAINATEARVMRAYQDNIVLGVANTYWGNATWRKAAEIRKSGIAGKFLHGTITYNQAWALDNSPWRMNADEAGEEGLFNDL